MASTGRPGRREKVPGIDFRNYAFGKFIIVSCVIARNEVCDEAISVHGLLRLNLKVYQKAINWDYFVAKTNEPRSSQ
jgi:hypothetical protein